MLNADGSNSITRFCSQPPVNHCLREPIGISHYTITHYLGLGPLLDSV